MRPGPKSKPLHLKIVDGTARPDRDVILDGPLVAPVRPKFIKGRAAKIWDAMIARHPEWTEFQGAILETYCQLKAEYETDPDAMATARIVELRRQAELLLAPRGKVENAKADPTEGYFN